MRLRRRRRRFLGWQYIVDADAETFSVDDDGSPPTTWPWSALPSDDAFSAFADRYDEEDEDQGEDYDPDE